MTPTHRLASLSVLVTLFAACSNGGNGTSSSTGTTTSTTTTTTGTGTTTSSGTTGTSSTTTTSGTTTGTSTGTSTGTGTTGGPATFQLSDLQQLADNGVSPLDAGVALTLPPDLAASPQGAQAGDPVTLLCEVQPIDQPFLNAANVPGAGIPSTQPVIKATLPPLDAGSYHWQVQGTNSSGLTDWYPFNDGGLAFTICGSGTCPDSTGSVCATTDVTTDPNNCWACGNSCFGGWCDPNFPDGGEPGSGGEFGCHTPSVLQAGLSAPAIAAVNQKSQCYYYAQATGVNSQSYTVPLTAADWYPLDRANGQFPIAMGADPNGMALAILANPNDAGLVSQVLYFPNDGGCSTGLNTVIDSASGTYHGVASDGTNVYLTLTVVVNPDAGTTDDQVWKIPIASSMPQILLRNQKSLSDILYNPVAARLFFLSRSVSGSPNQVYTMGTDGSAPVAVVPAAPEAFGPSPALAYSPTVGVPNGTLYWTGITGVYSSGGGNTKIISNLNAPTGITTFIEGTSPTDAVIVTTSDGKVIEWHSATSTSETLASGQAHPDYPLPYAQTCSSPTSCTYQMTWLSELLNGNGNWSAIDFPN